MQLQCLNTTRNENCVRTPRIICLGEKLRHDVLADDFLPILQQRIEDVGRRTSTLDVPHVIPKQNRNEREDKHQQENRENRREHICYLCPEAITP